MENEIQVSELDAQIIHSDEQMPDETAAEDEAASHTGDAEASAGEQSEEDYSRIAEEDLKLLRRDFPELSGIESITELPNPLRYAALRDLGLTASEAYLATAPRIRSNGKAHLKSAVPTAAAPAALSMSQSELHSARELFGNLSDRELQRLYKKVTR